MQFADNHAYTPAPDTVMTSPSLAWLLPPFPRLQMILPHFAITNVLTCALSFLNSKCKKGGATSSSVLVSNTNTFASFSLGVGGTLLARRGGSYIAKLPTCKYCAITFGGRD